MKDFIPITTGEIRFLDAVLLFNPTTYSNKTDLEIIGEFFKPFFFIESFNFGAYYQIDQIDFEISMLSSSSEGQNEIIEKQFNYLSENHEIAKILNGENHLIKQLEDKSFALLLPVVSSSGLLGILFFSFTRSPETDILLKNIQLMVNILSQLIDTHYSFQKFQKVEKEKDSEIARVTEEIAKSSRRLTRILEAIPSGILLYHQSDKTIQDVNFKACEILEQDKHQLLGTNRDNHFFALKKDEKIEGFDNTESLAKSSSGKLVPVITTVSKIIIGGKDYLLESFSDITEKKKLQDALLKAHFELESKVEKRTQELKKANEELIVEMQERLKAQGEQSKLLLTVQQTPVGIYITSTKGIIEYANPSFLELIGYEKDEIIGSTPKVFLTDKVGREVIRDFFQTVRSGNVWKGDLQVSTKNGKLIWVSTSVSAIRDSLGKTTHFACIQEDISLVKLTEEKLTRAKEVAEESERIKSSLMNNLSHEFRTPLISILGFSELLSDEIEDEELKEIAKRIGYSGQRLLRTLNNIISLSEIESNNFVINLQNQDIIPCVKKLLSSMNERLITKNLEHNLISVKDYYNAIVDIDLLETSLERIIDNAIEYTEKGKVDIIIDSIKENDLNWIVITVKDTGVGISESNIGKIFEAFRQESEGYSRNFDGMGLGLNIANTYIKSIKGKIRVKSVEGEGSEFSIWLPAA